MSETDRDAIMACITSLIFVIGTSLWVFTDAKTHYQALLEHQPDGDNRASGYAFGWFSMCAFFWIFCFPAYLIARSTSASDSDLRVLNAQRKGDPVSIGFLFKTRKKPVSIPAGTSAAEVESTMECPFCAEVIKRNAKICRFCQRELRPQAWTPSQRCFECGGEVSPESKHCTHCGAPTVSTPREFKRQATVWSFVAVISGLMLLSTIFMWPQLERFLKSGQATAVSMHRTMNVPTSEGELPSPPTETTRTVPPTAVEKPDSDPMRVIHNLYRDYKGLSLDRTKNRYLEKYLDRGLLQLIQNNPEKMDFDPIWNTDAEIDGTAVSVQRERKLSAGQVSIEALLDRGASESTTVTYTLVKKPAGWRITDIADDGMSVRKRLTDVSRAPNEVPAVPLEITSRPKPVSFGGGTLDSSTSSADGEVRSSAAATNFDAVKEPQVQASVSTYATDEDMERYIKDLNRRIKKHWFPPKGNESKRITVTFKILSGGELSGLHLDGSSGVESADNAALKAVADAAPFRPLPAGAPDSVDIRFNFDYNASK